jgi:hypothetical protein
MIEYEKMILCASRFHMKKIVAPALVCLSLAISASASSQIPNFWNKIDTLTSGEYDDVNPSLVHNAYSPSPGQFLCVVFERHTSAGSQIAVRKMSRSTARWDSVVVISPESPGAEQELPDYSEVSYYDTSPGAHVMRLAAWQVKRENRWQIYYSMLNNAEPAWSPPALLVADSVDNTEVQVRPYSDSALMVTWKRSNTVMGALKRVSSISPVETLAVSGNDSLEYDIESEYGQIGLIWTSDVQGMKTPLYKQSYQFGQFPSAVPETLRVPSPCSRPRLVITWAGNPSLTFETLKAGRWDVMYHLDYYMYPWGSLSDDPSSDNHNGRSFIFPYVVKQGVRSPDLIPSALGLVVYEKYRGSDSSLVFFSGGLSDTVRSPGHNTNALIGSPTLSTPTGQNDIVVWESNRSGRSHIYSRQVNIYFDAIVGTPHSPSSFELLQNYPNPFNPSTVISYRLPGRSPVTLDVFNAIGQRTTRLVNETQDAGIHEIRFDGSNLASGVYFYRLSTVNATYSKAMMLIR